MINILDANFGSRLFILFSFPTLFHPEPPHRCLREGPGEKVAEREHRQSAGGHPRGWAQGQPSGEGCLLGGYGSSRGRGSQARRLPGVWSVHSLLVWSLLEDAGHWCGTLLSDLLSVWHWPDRLPCLRGCWLQLARRTQRLCRDARPRGRKKQSRSPWTPPSRRSEFPSQRSRLQWESQPSSPGLSSSSRWEVPAPRAVESGMDATLLAIVASRKPAFKVFLDDHGIQTCSDLKYSWESGKQLLATYEATIGKLPSDEAFQLLLIYTLAASQAHVATGAQIRAIVDERESVIPGRPAMRPVRARSVITTGLTERTPNLIEAASSDPHTAEQARREMKTQAWFQFAVEHLVDLQELGLSWKALNDPARMQALRESLMACTLRLPRRLVRGWTTWTALRSASDASGACQGACTRCCPSNVAGFTERAFGLTAGQPYSASRDFWENSVWHCVSRWGFSTPLPSASRSISFFL